ncbi:hypothetical protein R1flu_013872 [Riccia fluitans]|uniref:Uncharacterized protein n=1 Tax=Riccia fluitans TaxID=41844 RepID=A0ABD1YEH8_9MARC
MGSLDSNMPLGGFHPSIATDESIGWETIPEGTTKQPTKMPQNMAGHMESPIMPIVKDDNGLPMEVAWAITFNMKISREDFKRYDNAKWVAGKVNIKKFCENQWLIDHWEAWEIQEDGGTLKRSKVRKSFLFYVGLENEGIKID